MDTSTIDRRRITPEHITTLEDGQIFVFGSNAAGMHGGGAARYAYEHFGAEWGVGVGLTGRCYAIPTMDGDLQIMQDHISSFILLAKQFPDLTFFVTPIGCGIAGYTPQEIAPMFQAAVSVPNITLPLSFWKVL